MLFLHVMLIGMYVAQMRMYFVCFSPADSSRFVDVVLVKNQKGTTDSIDQCYSHK